MADKDYSSIERPYGPHLEREADLALDLGGDGQFQGYGAGQDTSASSGSASSPTVVKGESSIGNLWISNWIRSKNWKPKTQGFYLDGGTGYAEFSNVYVAGSINLSTTSSLAGGQTDYDTGTGFFLGYSGGAYKFSLGVGGGVGPSLTWNGTTLTAIGGVITSPIITSPASGTDISLLAYTHNLTFSSTDSDTVSWSSGTITMSSGQTFSINAGSTLNMATRTYVYLNTAVSTTVLQVSTLASDTAGANRILIAVAQNATGQAVFQVYGGAGGLKISSSQAPISNNDWTFSGTWSVLDSDTLQWSSGTLKVSNGTSYTIAAGNTGNMTTKTYVFFDLSISTTAFQTTTTSTSSVGDGRILIAVAQNGSTEATYTVVNDKQSNIDAANIAAGSITANEIAAGSITSNKISVDQLDAIAVNMGALTSGTITLNTSGHIKGGQSGYDTGTGFFLGLSGGIHKFSIGVGGSTDQILKWDGTKLVINGYENTGMGASGGNGALGALTVPTGTTTTLNAGTLYQYSSVDIQGTGKLKFTGNGIAMILCSGNFTMSSTCEIDTRFASTTKVGNVVGVHALQGTAGYAAQTLSVGGAQADGGIGSTSGGAGGSGTGSGAGTGGAGGGIGSNGTAGTAGTTGTTGGGGGGGGGGTSGSGATGGTAGANASGTNGGNGGTGGASTADTGADGGSGGSGGAGTGSGNGGSGGNGGQGNSHGEYGGGGNGGSSGSTGGNGGNGGSGSPGGNGGDGFVNGGNGGSYVGTSNGSSSLYAGGNGGAGRTGTGGVGGTGGSGTGFNNNSGGTGGAGGAGGTTGGAGGTGGNGGSLSAGGYGGTGGVGGAGLTGSAPLFIFVSGNLTVGGTVRAGGGNGGAGGAGGNSQIGNKNGGTGGAGGAGGDGADVFMLCKGTYTDNGVSVLNTGGIGGNGGNGGAPSGTGATGATGTNGRDGTSGKTIMGRVTL